MPKEGQSKGWPRGSDCCGWVVVETRKPGICNFYGEEKEEDGWMQRGEAEPCVSAFIGEVMEKTGKSGGSNNSSSGDGLSCNELYSTEGLSGICHVWARFKGR